MQLHSPVRAALLLGAGASHFAGFPTVDSFFSHVWPNRGTRLDELCSQIARRISIYEGNSENMRWPTFDAEKVFGWLEILDKAHQIQTVDGGLGAVTISNNRGASMSANELMTELKSEIVRAYSRELTPETLTAAPHNELLKLLDTLIPETEPLHIFTTNYDGLLEQLFRHWNNGNSQIHKQFRVSNGFPLDQPRRWQANLLEEKPIPGVRLIKLAKLHGSITWKADYDGSIIDTGWARATDHDVLLYFGYKSVPESEPFFTFHQLLKSTLLQYDFLIAVGFRFGDPYIYELFDFALRANRKLRVIYSLTRSPESGAPLSRLSAQFPGRVGLLTNTTGESIPFGHRDFRDSLTLALGQTNP